MTIPGFLCFILTGGPPPDAMLCRQSATPAICVTSINDTSVARCWVADKVTQTKDGIVFRLQRKKVKLKGDDDLWW